MSDEEEYYEEEEEVEEEEEEVEEAAEEKEEEAEAVEEDLNEAEKAMIAAKQRHDADDEDKLQDYEDRRNEERSKEDEEIRKLKEKQEKRRLEREKEEREMAERKRLDEERRKAEEDERRAKQEEEKRRKEEEKKKKQAQLMGTFAQPGEGGRNFVLPQKAAGAAQGDKFGNIVQAKQEMGMTKEQQEETKRAFLAKVKETIQALSEIASSELKNKIKEIHQRICKLEADKYDLENRHERQEYDMRELNERQRQVARNNALKAGVDPNEASGRHPPKVQVFSKYDRQIDRRNFKERRAVYDTKVAYPVFPGLPPPPSVYEKVIAKYAHEIQEEQDAAYSKQYEVEDEEEEEE